MFAPAVPDMMKEFRDDSSAMASLVVSVYVVGFALGPLVFAPLSEIYGRLYVYHVSNVLFLVFTAGCALSTQTGMFVAFRLLAGCVGATPMVLGGGSIADIIPPERRGTAMTLWGAGQLFGPARAPIAMQILHRQNPCPCADHRPCNLGNWACWRRFSKRGGWMEVDLLGHSDIGE